MSIRLMELHDKGRKRDNTFLLYLPTGNCLVDLLYTASSGKSTVSRLNPRAIRACKAWSLGDGIGCAACFLFVYVEYKPKKRDRNTASGAKEECKKQVKESKEEGVSSVAGKSGAARPAKKHTFRGDKL
ncbi:hypothetical protein GW17_00016529 [Ensete ventricosum]|nr:hypothetical protein GW17_00016529 [Ensete ventricosum]